MYIFNLFEQYSNSDLDGVNYNTDQRLHKRRRMLRDTCRFYGPFCSNIRFPVLR